MWPNSRVFGYCLFTHNWISSAMVSEFHFKSEQTAGRNESTININWSLTITPKANVQQGWNLFILPKCILCWKFKTWLNGRTERTAKLQSWKHEKPVCTSTEERAELLGKAALLCKVKVVDVFTKEAHYHKTCHNRFNTEYVNHTTKKASKKNTDTFQVMKTAAHDTAYTLV